MCSFESIVRTNMLLYILQTSLTVIQVCAARVVFTIGGSFLLRLLSIAIIRAFSTVAALVATTLASVSLI
jgi:hypothetical protein